MHHNCRERFKERMIHFQSQRLLFASDMLMVEKKTPWSRIKLRGKSEKWSYMLKNRDNCFTSILIIHLCAQTFLTPLILDWIFKRHGNHSEDWHLRKNLLKKKNLVSRKLSVNKEKRRKPFHSWLSSVKNIVSPVEQWGWTKIPLVIIFSRLTKNSSRLCACYQMLEHKNLCQSVFPIWVFSRLFQRRI